MRLRDHRETARLLDAEQADILEYLDGKDKAGEEYTAAAQNLKTLEETKKMEVDMIHEKESLLSEFVRGVAAGALSAGTVFIIWNSEKNGSVMLNQSDKGFIRDASRFKFKPGH